MTNNLEKTQAIVEGTKGQEINEPSIYVACLAAYNSGHLHGSWIVPSQDEEELQEQINKILKSSPVAYAEEWAIHDYNNFPNLGEYPSIKNICAIAEAMETFEPTVVHGYLENFGYSHVDYDTLIGDIDDAFIGTYDSFRDFADDTAEDTLLMDCPEHIRNYFDYDAYARDLEMDYFTSEASGYQVHIFRNY